MNVACDLKIEVTAVAKAKLDALLVEYGPLETSTIGLVDRVEDTFIITDVFVIEQENGCSSTDMDEAALDAFLTGLLKTDKSKFEKVKLWMHSHGNGGVFWSSTDDNTIKGIAGDNCPWFISIVANSSLQYLARLDMKYPIDATFHDVPVSLCLRETLTEEEEKELEAEVRRKVSRKYYARNFHKNKKVKAKHVNSSDSSKYTYVWDKNKEDWVLKSDYMKEH